MQPNDIAFLILIGVPLATFSLGVTCTIVVYFIKLCQELWERGVQ